ncbi:MCE family protein [Actinomadura scrupuli]|uniref:MCE family protein n=1 Tax=Actinomadura scrupuli TaxID=559629 RepID=UPI003D97C939
MPAEHIVGARARLRRATLARLVVFLTVTGLLTAFIGIQIKRVSFTGGYHLSATFEDASGLRAGDQVKIAGAPVGRVDSVRVVDGRARVGFTVDDGVHVPADSQAAIRWRDALGRRVVYLMPGTSPDSMRPGTHITRTRSVVDSGELINDLAPLTRSLDADQVNQLLVSLSQALDGNADDLGDLIANVDTLSATIATRRRTLSRMLADYSTVTALIARRDKQIGQSVDNLVELSGAFTRNRALIDDTLVQLSLLARTSNDVLGKNSDQLGQVLARLAVLTGGVRRNTAVLAQVLREAGPKLQHIFAAVDNGRFIDVAVPCVTLVAPPCPYPTRLPGSLEGSGPVTSGSALRRLMIGGG